MTIKPPENLVYDNEVIRLTGTDGTEETNDDTQQSQDQRFEIHLAIKQMLHVKQISPSHFWTAALTQCIVIQNMTVCHGNVGFTLF